MAATATVEAVQQKTTFRQSDSPPEELSLEERKDVTVDELERMSLPYQAELYNGEVIYKMAGFEHGMIQGEIYAILKSFLKENPIGFVAVEANFRLWPERRNESRIPDVAFIKKENLPEDIRRFPAGAPDLAVEIISPEDNFLKVMNKVDDYLDAGTRVVWLVISDTREVLVCTKDKKYSVRETLTLPELLPGFETPVQKIFDSLPKPETT